MTEKKTRDELAKRLVEREIMVCQSGLIDTILKHGWDDRWVADELFTIDDIENYYIRHDIDELIRENPQEYEAFILDNEDLLFDTYQDWWEQYRETPSEDHFDAEAFLDWLVEHAPFSNAEQQIRMTREELLVNIELDEDDIETLYDYFKRNDVEIQDEYSEIYEWWVVSDWLIGLLKEKGEAVIDQWGGPWWGRRTTGQAIYMDSVIQEIAWELWGDEKDDTEDSTENS